MKNYKIVYIILGVLIMTLIGIARYIKREGKWNEYKPFNECYGVSDWYRKNENTRERERFDCVVSIIVSIITSVATSFYLLKK